MEISMEQMPEPSRYQVFINCTVGTKKTLASLIYHRLKSHGLRVFLDKEEIICGETIITRVVEAIRSSAVHIAIFSRGYAESRSCLEELVEILRSRSVPTGQSMLFPVFYDVKPSELSNIEHGSYAKAFKNHERNGRVSLEVIYKWKTALMEASNISGLDFEHYGSDQGIFLEKVVTCVLKAVNWSRHLEGVEKNVLKEVRPEQLEVATQVFINYTVDTKRTLASLIYHRLKSHGLRVVLDKEEIMSGETIFTQVEEAIWSSAVHIAIFSRGYAESRWCLEELVEILRSRSVHTGQSKIIPVFYDVEPADIRNIEHGSYAEAFKNYELKGRVSLEVISQWKTALKEASGIFGLVFEHNESDQGIFVEKVVESVLNAVNWSRHLEGVAKNVLKEVRPEQLEVATQVFISHRIPDVKNSLASLVYNHLANCYGLRVVMDEERIRTKDAPSRTNPTAILCASVHIVFFSENYAESFGCLNELCWILTSFRTRQSKLIPVFYDVEPTDIRHIEHGSYAKAFENHERKGGVSLEVISKWKTALKEASEISGLVFKHNESDQGIFLENVVESVLNAVYRSRHLEGVEENVLKEVRPEQLEVTTQVFISHRIPDVKNSLASLVYNHLANCYGLRVFMDEEGIPTEGAPSGTIPTAILCASVHIVFFSENYAESLGCLDELCWILGSSHQHTLIPVFCDVEPDDLLFIDKGCYAKAFQKHEEKREVAIEVVEGWKEALRKAADIPGPLLKTKTSDSGELLEEIAKKVLEELRWEPLQVAPHVFINHTGPDFKITLASLMYNRLKICGFRGFHDNKELQTADTLSAISSASLHIAIFTNDYAQSHPCLNELSSIFESCHKNGSSVIPVFCGVKPADLRDIDKGCYAEAFGQHQRDTTVSKEVVQGWKMALQEASKISGLLFKANESDYGEFLQIFVEIVLNKVKWEAVQGPPVVFINHKGPEVNITLASLIDNRLKICGLRIFDDNKELQTGDTLSTPILNAIRTASLHIVIFSRDFAYSSRCLDELSWILKTSPASKIIPVFCDVEPVDFRYLRNGRYAGAFQKHLHSGKVVDTWETALSQASQISGLFFKMNESEKGGFLERIVEKVLDGVKWEPLEVATYPVGLDQAAEHFQNEILNQSISSPSRIVGIAGIGGVGKSTLVKYIFNLTRSDFSRSCYLSNTREKVDLPCLQRQLLRDLLGFDYIINITEGKRILRDRLRGLRILIVLDSMDCIEQIDSLVDMEALGRGSLILLTSRDKDFLASFSPKILLYDVKPLNRQNAKELFCRHTFLQFKPPEGYEDLVEVVLEICGGLPLSLEVFGGLLASNLDKTYWKLQLKKFSKRLPDDILETLKVSYLNLNKKEKEMFLDIGCFLAGEDIELAVRVLEGSGYTNVRNTLESLRRNCLLDFQNDAELNNSINYKDTHPDILRLTMHNQLTGLARHIAREEFELKHKPYRLSCSNDFNEMLQLQDGSDFCWIRGIRIPKPQNPPQLMNHISIRGVRFLVVENTMDLSSFCMSGDLVWLRLNNFQSISIPSTISLANLRVLELHSLGDSSEQLLQVSDELSSELGESNTSARTSSSASASSSHRPFDVEHDMQFSRNISNTQQRVMPSFSRFIQWTGTFMNKIVLKNMETLELLPIDFSELKNLRHLDLSGCIHLTKLSNSFSQLLRLQYLALRDCKNLSMPTDILGEISTLEYVDFKGCAQLEHLPTGMVCQRSLKYLDLLCTPKLQLPVNLEPLDQLEQLRIGSGQLTELPQCVGRLMSLRVLVLIECWGLKNILQAEIAGSHIEVLVIRGSPIAELSFEDQGTTDIVAALRDFSFRNTNISEICIPAAVYPRLETLDLSGNIRLRQVNALPSLLLSLNLENCNELKTLTNLSNLAHLKFLNINRCIGLETLNVHGLISLEEIKAEGCWKLKRIGGLSHRKRLKCLKISTGNSVLWIDICNFLALRPFDGKLSTASFGGTVDVGIMVLDAREMRCNMAKFNVKMVDIVSAPTTSGRFQVKVENLHSHGAILMCFITSGLSPGRFCVRFEENNYGGPTWEYTSLRGSEGGKNLHVFLWTEKSELFQDYKDYSNIHAFCSQVCVSKLDGAHVERGWMVMVDKATDVSQVCREFIRCILCV